MQKLRLVKKPEEVLEVIQVMRAQNVRGAMGELERIVDQVRDAHMHDNTTLLDFPHLFMRAGAAIASITHEAGDLAMAELLVQKHHDYGAEPLLRWGALGVFIRIDSKLRRFLNLQKMDDLAAVRTETLEDTTRDILGYCILGVIMLKRGAQL